jgi:hypothetical protein
VYDPLAAGVSPADPPDVSKLLRAFGPLSGRSRGSPSLVSGLSPLWELSLVA